MKPDSIPPLHVVTDDAVVARADVVEQARRMLEAGGPDVVFHLRAPRASGRRMHDLAAALRGTAVNEDAWLVVNDRVDVALAVADGAHVGGRGIAAADARRLLGPDRLLGVSVHSVDEARAAQTDGADYVLAGTIWETESHPGRAGAGVELIRQAAALGIPTIAIGGVTPERAMEARGAGAAGVAVIRGIWDAPDPVAAVIRYLRAWKGTMPDTLVAPATILVRVNGDERAIPAGVTVEGLLAHLELSPRMVVVEHNGDILRREQLAATAVNEGDQLELVHFVGGG